MQPQPMNSRPVYVHWSQRIYVRNYMAALIGVVAIGLLFGVAWYLHTDPGPGHRNPIVFIVVMVFFALVVAIGAFPVVRRLTRRLESLQLSLEAFGAGHLSTRVAVEGRDEVASLAASFNRSADYIEVLLNSQKTLLSNASHELRSPLARIRMAVEIMQERAQPEIRRELLRSMAELDQLIEEILLASRLDAIPDAVPNAENMDLTAVLAEECVSVDAHLDAQAVSICGDARLLRRMVRNLLENARRYGEGTPIMVKLAINGDQEVQLDVLDNGPGIPVTEVENIFIPFYRLPGTSEREGGVGLGLSLVRQIASAHGGAVFCLPHERGGSCFRVMLPMQPRPAAHSRDRTPG